MLTSFKEGVMSGLVSLPNFTEYFTAAQNGNEYHNNLIQATITSVYELGMCNHFL